MEVKQGKQQQLLVKTFSPRVTYDLSSVLFCCGAADRDLGRCHSRGRWFRRGLHLLDHLLRQLVLIAAADDDKARIADESPRLNVRCNVPGQTKDLSPPPIIIIMMMIKLIMIMH